MKRYLKFAASFWMSAFLIAGSIAGAQTTPTAKAKKSGSSTTPANTTNSSQSTATTSTNTASGSQTNVTAHDQSSGTNATTTTPTTTPAPKTMVGPDKHTILVPQL
jgi:hypothetical protein